ncbi:SDR family NAD(P)-dependent oxidoreductase [Caenimonas soli]|uniref:SDR family NAD(P)-dependent oxidoreductase n=1 Tax=Caenimonas soli TaxID=2735555 RepID=UPI001A9BE676|nr:SDR family NAD(P)-dependent oxidoreductase [Caenimonas soli]
MRMQGRVAVVTGAGNGLGREHALLLAREGARVVVNDPGGSVNGAGGDNAAADKVVAQIRAAGGNAVANYDSVATPEGAQRLIDTAVKSFGRVDALINNAGILRDKSFAKMALEDFEAVLRIHLLGSTYCTKAAWPLMIEQKYGRVIMTTSVAGTSGNFGQANYGAAKMGLLGLMNVLAVEGAKANIKVNAVSPGATTRMTQGLGAVSSEIDELMQAAHVAPAVAYMASEDCDFSANIITAAAGGFGRVQFFETAGVQFDPRKPITVDMFADAVGRLTDLGTAKPTAPGVLGQMPARLATVGILL